MLCNILFGQQNRYGYLFLTKEERLSAYMLRCVNMCVGSYFGGWRDFCNFDKNLSYNDRE